MKRVREERRMIENEFENRPLLEVENLTKEFAISFHRFGRKKKKFLAVDHVSFQVYPRETLGIVGESGCGKSTLGKMIMKLIEPTEGCIKFEGTDISNIKGAQLKQLREQMQIVFQDPYGSLNPKMSVRNLIGEPLEIAGKTEHIDERVVELMEQVGMHARDLERFSYEFSGGQRQRICIARAIALEPKLLVCDEPVSALDVSVQSQILNLFNKLKQELGLTYIFISHDLSVIQHVSDKICVMYLGQVVEFGTTEEVYGNPLHPYTKCLLSAVLQPDVNTKRVRNSISLGEITGKETESAGCAFYTRCPYAMERCKTEKANQKRMTETHTVSCHLYEK